MMLNLLSEVTKRQIFTLKKLVFQGSHTPDWEQIILEAASEFDSLANC